MTIPPRFFCDGWPQFLPESLLERSVFRRAAQRRLAANERLEVAGPCRLDVNDPHFSPPLDDLLRGEGQHFTLFPRVKGREVRCAPLHRHGDDLEFPGLLHCWAEGRPLLLDFRGFVEGCPKLSL
jgi:hypothetical protein